MRLRIGVGHPGDKDAVTGYVLNRARAEEQALIEQAVERALDRFELIAAGDFQRAMNDLHRRADDSPDDADDDT
jgi:PTH1 family peptidyl-tRNA hydrolase